MSTYKEHPILKKNGIFIVTNQMVRAIKLAVDRIVAGRTAIIFEGDSRLGKSMCAEFLEKMLITKFPEAHVTLCIAKPREGNANNQLLKEICYAEHLLAKPKIDYFFHLIGGIKSRMLERKQTKYILILDKIQCLRSLDYTVLAALYNYLVRDKLSVTVIGFSQSGICEKRSGFQLIEQRQLVARFLTEVVQFRGCENLTDVTAILSAYDSPSDYPEGTGIPYTEFFLPNAFSCGFRLADLSSEFFEFFSSKTTGNYNNNIPLEHLVDSIRNLLTEAALYDSNSYKISRKDIERAIDKTNIKVFCGAL